MNKRDYYEVLQISRDASETAIKKAYRKLAYKYHPDRNSDEGAEGKFKEASEAYEVLSSPQKRESYDEFGFSSLHPGPTHVHTDPFDMFNSFFGGIRHPRKGRDLHVEISLNLEDVLSGIKKKITYMRHFKCKMCKGVGGTGNPCGTCGGYGQIRQQSGFFQVISTCPKCQGSRIEINTQCSKCEGTGEIGEKYTTNIEIPVGVRTGNHIKVNGEGDLTEDNLPPGDLVCKIKVKPHAVFQRKDRDIQCVCEISFTSACLGTKIMIPILGEKEKEFIIPPGTQFGQSFRVKDKGLPTPNRSSMRGDQFVKIHINVPENLTPEKQDILRQFDKKTKD